MKTILAILLTCLPLCAATTYTVTTDTATPGQGQKAIFTGGTTNILLRNTAGTVTATQNFAAPQNLTNASNTISGNGAGLIGLNLGANSIGLRLLWASPTNIYLPTLATNATLALTNNGDWANCTAIGYGTIPPLLSTNSTVLLTFFRLNTNTSTSTGVGTVFIGPNTNFVGSVTVGVTTIAQAYGSLANALMQCAGATNSQLQGNVFATPLILGPTNFFDSSVSNTIYIGGMTASDHRNLQLFGLKIYEAVGSP